MNIQEEGREGQLINLSVTISKDDYFPEYEQQLKNYRRQMSMPGFRPGTVPKSIVRKRVGIPLLVETVNKLAGKSLTDYIKENDLPVFGVPVLADTDLGKLEPFDEAEYTMDFQIGVYPDAKIDIEALPKVNKYTVEITEADIDTALNMQRLRHGVRVPLQTVQKDGSTFIKAEFKEKDENGGFKPEGLVFSLEFYSDYYPHVVEKLLGKAVGDTIEITLDSFFNKKEDGVRALDITPTTWEELKDRTLELKIEKLEGVNLAELNETFFRLFVPENEPEKQTEAGLRQVFREALEQHARDQAERHFKWALDKALLEQVNVEVPVEFVANVLMATMGEKIETIEQLYEKHPNFYYEFKLHIAHHVLTQQYKDDLDVTEEELVADTKAYLSQILGGALPSEPEPETNETEFEELDENGEVVAKTEAPAKEMIMIDEGDDELTNLAGGVNPNIDGILQYMMRDKNFVERRDGELRQTKLYGFLENKLKAGDKALSKDEFDRLYVLNLTE